MSTEVTYEDQQQINTFNKANQHMHELEAELKAQRALTEDLEDASNELVLNDEEHIRFVVGESFYHAGPEEAEERITSAQEQVAEDIKKSEAAVEQVKQDMTTLKQALYAKFGSSINLEE